MKLGQPFLYFVDEAEAGIQYFFVSTLVLSNKYSSTVVEVLTMECWFNKELWIQLL